jgi:hypothetical protein
MDLFPTDLQNLMPHLDVCHPSGCRLAFISRGVSRKKLLAWPATQVQSGGGIVDTGKPTGIRWRESTRSMADLCALFRLDLMKDTPGDKVAWIGGGETALI